MHAKVILGNNIVDSSLKETYEIKPFEVRRKSKINNTWFI